MASVLQRGHVAIPVSSKPGRQHRTLHHLSKPGVCPKPLRKSCITKVVESAAPGIIHISETWILDGSVITGLAIPWAASFFLGNKVEQIVADEVPALMNLEVWQDEAEDVGHVRLVDIRSEEEILREGVPIGGLFNMDHIIHAPWYQTANGKMQRNKDIVNDVLFSFHARKGNSYILLDSHGELSSQAANEFTKLGDHLKVYTVQGGFKAWRASNLPFSEVAQDCRIYASVKTPAQQARAAAATTSANTNWVKPPPLAAISAAAEQNGFSTPVVVPEVVPPGPAPSSTSFTGVRAPRFRPKMLDVIAEGYTKENLREDVLSGLVVGVIALSLSMALGIASESTPAIGLITAVVSGFLISALGGSRVCVGGPTAAFIPIVVGVVHDYGPENLVVCTGLAGLFLIGMGVTGLGTFIKYIPRPVVTGFTAGIATYIFSTQLKDFLGLGVPGHLPEGVPVPAEFLEKVLYLGSHLDSTHVPSLTLAAGTFAMMKLWPTSWAKVAPPQIAAVVVGTSAMVVMNNMGVDMGIETIGSHFGVNAIPSSIPLPHWPSGASLDAIPGLIYPAFTISLLAAIESLLCARVSDTFIDDRHNSNTELIAQGIANLASAAFGGLPSTGALARTAANVRAGGRTPVAGMVHAVTVLLIMLVASPVAQYIPLPALSAVLVVVAINMGEWRNFQALPSWPQADAQLFIIAFMLTVLQDVAVAVEFGMVAAVLLFVQEVTSSTRVRQLKPLAMVPGAVEAVAAPRKMTVVPRNAMYIEVTGSLLFGAGDMLEEVMEEMHLDNDVNVVVVDLSNVSVMDVSGMEVMEEELKRLQKNKKHMVVCGLEQQPLQMLARAGFLQQVGRDNVCRTADEALRRAMALDQVRLDLPEFQVLEPLESLDILYYV